MITKNGLALFQLHISIFLFGFSGLFGKWLSLSPFVIVCGRVFFAAIFLGILLTFQKQTILPILRKSPGKLLFPGFLLAFHWFSFFHAIQLSTVAVGLIGYATFPMFVVLIDGFQKRSLPSGKYLIASLLCLLGVMLIVPLSGSLSSKAQGLIWAILSGFSFALLSLSNQQLVQRYSPFLIAFYQSCSAWVILLPFVFVSWKGTNPQELGLIMVLGVVFTGLSHSLFIASMKHISTQVASIVSSLEPVYGILTAIIFLNEYPTEREIIGGLIILACAAYVSISAQIRS